MAAFPFLYVFERIVASWTSAKTSDKKNTRNCLTNKGTYQFVGRDLTSDKAINLCSVSPYQ